MKTNNHENDITRSAAGEICTIRIPGHCNHNNETTVFAHKNGRGGAPRYVGAANIQGAYACSDCHDVVDGRQNCHQTALDIKRFHYEGIFRTQQRLVDKGLIIINF